MKVQNVIKAIKTLTSPELANAPKPQPMAEPQTVPTVQPNCYFFRPLLEDAGLLEAAEKIIEAGERKQKEIAKGLAGLSHPETIQRCNQQMRDVMDGKLDASLAPLKTGELRIAALKRAIVKSKMAVASNGDCAAFADLLEKALDGSFARYSARLLATESAVSPIVEKLGPTPLRKLLAEMPKFARFHIQKLRTPQDAPRSLSGIISPGNLNP